MTLRSEARTQTFDAMNDWINVALATSMEAGQAIMDIYESDDVGIDKEDASRLPADRAAHQVILRHLEPTGIPSFPRKASTCRSRTDPVGRIVDCRPCGRHQGIHQAKRRIHRQRRAGPSRSRRRRGGSGSRLGPCLRRNRWRRGVAVELPGRRRPKKRGTPERRYPDAGIGPSQSWQAVPTCRQKRRPTWTRHAPSTAK